MKITLNMTWDEVERSFRSTDDETFRDIISLACEEIDDRDHTISVVQQIIDISKYNELEDVVTELTEFSEFMNFHEFVSPSDAYEAYAKLKFQHDFRKLFQL